MTVRKLSRRADVVHCRSPVGGGLSPVAGVSLLDWGDCHDLAVGRCAGPLDPGIGGE